ncbi:ATP-binding protein [Sphaerisporangium perillae]|uniref:ATP-binding protein n=1 Tax=Sphaerisporangium perillae TaxID=2935860 RepID=UPI002010BDBF|nr:ATP-binding protein [Sphaerisporangium perillae]
MATEFLSGSLDLVGTEASVPVARAFVRATLGAGHPALDDVTLLASELTTNAVVHSNSRDGGPVRITLAETDQAIRVTVQDAGADTLPIVSGDLSGEGGRGLFLVEQLSGHWGIDEDATGRAVWCEVKF